MAISEELKLDYPCEWEYKLFISCEHCAHSIVKEILEERLHHLEASKASQKGTYSSYALSLVVHTEEERLALFQSFKSHQHIKFVL